MTDPYKVLGVSPNISDEELKKAYRELARKYHPDNYRNNPLTDLASEKMKEINEAYDIITKQRAAKTGSGYNSGGTRRTSGTWQQGGYTGANAVLFNQVREQINAGRIDQAQQILDTVGERGSEWHFLMGSVYYRKGWVDEAAKYYQIATSMDPQNEEYRQALMFVNAGGSIFGGGARGMSMPGLNCDLCTSMICMNLFCSCLRGGRC